jgi:hypothetical protein
MRATSSSRGPAAWGACGAALRRRRSALYRAAGGELARDAKVVEDLACEDTPKDYDLRWRIYAAGGASLNGVPTAAAPGEICRLSQPDRSP